MLNTGHNLEIAAKFTNSIQNRWMAYGLWYSLVKILPNSKIIFVIDNSYVNMDCFNWVNKFNIQISKKPENFDYLHNATTLAVRHYHDNLLGPSGSKTEDMTCLVDYKEGVGDFNSSVWLNSNKAPFAFTKKIKKSCNTVNEHATLKMWSQCEKYYNLL